MRSSDRGAGTYARRDTLSALLVLGLAAAVLLFGVERHGVWDPLEVDALAAGGPASWLGWSTLSPRAVQALIGCGIVLIAVRGAIWLGGRRAALTTACVLLSMPGLVLSSRLVIVPTLGTLASASMIVGAIGAVAPGRQRGRGLDYALLLGGAVLLMRGPVEQIALPAITVGAALFARGGRARRPWVVAGAALGLAAAVAFAGARAPEDPGPSWATALEPAVYGALPWLAVAPWAALQLGVRRAGAVALLVWAALDPWLGPAGSTLWLPLAIVCGVGLARGLKLGPAVAIALGTALALGLDVHRSSAGLIGVGVGAPVEVPDGLWSGWAFLGFAAAPLAALAALARRHALVLGATCAASVGLGLLLAHGWTPALSGRLSHEGLFAALPPGQPLATLGMRPQSARFWTGAEPRQLGSALELMRFLDAPRRAFAIAPRAQHCRIRQRARADGAGLHVVADDERYLLLSNEPGREDRDPLRGVIEGTAPPDTGRAIRARLEHVDLIGVSLPASARRGARVEAALHFHVRESVGRDLRVLVHVDGPGPRFQGDHDPAERACATSTWLPGDYVTDRFSFDAGSLTHRPGRYAVHVGLYHGGPGRWVNLRVLEGPGDRFDRVFAGEIELR